ncbi:histidine kinase [Curtobacterium sp. MCLR17_007]|uniref:sensor histidine kinase n=1 Tax=Curtobacterium sp. MCLR17_007 TaxID=2175648 RepID=UPI000DA96EDB|nr:ATP-binding protein [Curtobacterium sp. MCLR17_007]WIB59174.1 histidine kinase [Curtobacterium sp. MCLR17_007]
MEIPEPLAPVLQRIAATSPELGDDPVMAASLYENVTSMLADAHRHYTDGLEASITGDQLLADEHLATGALHAERMQHPAGAMLAAEVLFDEYLPVFVDEVGATTPAELLRAARALHAGIWRRFPAGAVAYTEALRQRVTTANLDSRAHIARDLHDRVAHGILAGLQRIDLALLTDPPAPERTAQLEAAATQLRRALGDVQNLAVALHARVGDDLLDAALARHTADLFPDTERVTISSHGTPSVLVNWRAEEALTILLEALTNWWKHARDAAVRVVFTWSDDAVTVTVDDEGPGFDQDVLAQGRLGQSTMRERAALIGARLDVRSAPGAGTTVTLVVPQGAL